MLFRSVLIAKNKDHKAQIIETYFEGETEPVLSRLGSEPALRTHLLSLIASGTISTTEEMHSFLKKTLFGAQGELWRTQHRINKVLDFLDKEDLIEIEGKIEGEFIPANAPLQEKLKADCLGSHGNLSLYDYTLQRMGELQNEPIAPKPIITGDDLISLGLTPGPKFKAILSEIFDEQLEGNFHSKE